jgi:sulfite oxidase
MPRHEIVATLQCSGNRRAEFNTKSQTSGTPWYQGAISTAKWSGVRLRDILKAAGIDDDKLCQNLDAHVRFATLDDFHSSITIDKAYSITGDCIVAYEMNGEPIPGELSLTNNYNNTIHLFFFFFIFFTIFKYSKLPSNVTFSLY